MEFFSGMDLGSSHSSLVVNMHILSSPFFLPCRKTTPFASNSAKAIGCTVVNIGTQDLVEGRPHLVLELISQIIKIQLLADLNLKKTPQLVELVEDNKEGEELVGLAPEKLYGSNPAANLHIIFEKADQLTQDLELATTVSACHVVLSIDGEAYAYLLNALAPEYGTPNTLEVKDPGERAKMILEHAEKLDCKRYLTQKDIVEGSPNLNLAFVAQIFQHRNGLSVSADSQKMSFAEMMTDDEKHLGREMLPIVDEQSWNSYICGFFLEALTKFLQDQLTGSRHQSLLLRCLSERWRTATKSSINLIPLAASLAADEVYYASTPQELEAGLLQWKVSRIRAFPLGFSSSELLSAVEPRVVNWSLVTKGESAREKPPVSSSTAAVESENDTALEGEVSNLSVDDAAPEVGK
ncbi:Calponin homology domain [Dillenia turbinata]|uniref:Calponin homology domain n=1 Tax=Dillenia turbinata TaxID=194707 RepID=A0AAN8UU94_9MAGN